MQIWLDTTDAGLIKQAEAMQILSGVTTNPSILANTRQPPQQIIAELLQIQAGHVAVQVIENDYEGILRQARALHALNPRIIVKIPVIPAGLRAIAQLRQEKITTLATAIFTANQVLLAGLVQADYAAPYLARISAEKGEYIAELEQMLTLIQKQRFAIKIMAAAIKDVQQIAVCAALGVPAITLPGNVFREWISVYPGTQASLEKFAADWRESLGQTALV